MLPILTHLMQRNAAPLAAPKDPSHETAEQVSGEPMERAETTIEDVMEAFRVGDFRDTTDETLLAYLQVLSNEHYVGANDQLQANSRCIRLNAELMLRQARRISRQTSVLAVVAVLLAVGQLIIALLALPR